jgi:hypothetical protein
MLISKQKVKKLKYCILSTTFEIILLVSYLILFPILASLASFESTSSLENYTLRKNLLNFYNSSYIDNIKDFD